MIRSLVIALRRVNAVIGFRASSAIIGKTSAGGQSMPSPLCDAVPLHERLRVLLQRTGSERAE